LIVKAVQKIVVNNVDPQKALDELEADFKRVYGQK
jgi:multiple sugar transport system substrate-binding protein